MINKQTTLDLNGPNISFTQQPQSAIINTNGSATFTGIATATFYTQTPPNPATGTGSLTYRWYESSFGALSDGTNSTLRATIAGSGTTTLSISNATRSDLRFYLAVDYIPSAYSQPQGAAVTSETTRSTGNATNEPATSDIAILTVRPTISVTQNPSSVDIGEGLFANFSAGGASSDGTPVSYRWQLNNNDILDGGNISGSGTPNLRISLPTASNNTVRARISHPTASNSPLFTNSANFNVFVPRAILNYEYTTDSSTSLFSSGSFDLRDGTIAFSYSPTLTSRVPVHPTSGIITIYPPERDVNVRVTLAAAAGGTAPDPNQPFGSTRLLGGGGGLTVFDLTLRRNVEYVIRTGIRFGLGNSPQGGYPNGGGGSYFYRQAEILVVSGGGGGAGPGYSGGFGGGALNAGGYGSGSIPGAGGNYVYPGSLGTIGSFSRDSTLQFTSASNFSTTFNYGGKLSSCPPGGRVGSSYWLNQGFSQCSNMGFVQAVNVDGSPISASTNTIQRGHKYGLGFRNNGGNGTSVICGGGGDGAYGGGGGRSFGGVYADSGGGASGYTNGEATIVSSTPGGNPFEYGYARIELR